MSNQVYKWAHRTWAAVFPLRCVLCDAATAPDRDLCPACMDDLPRIHLACPGCGVAMPVQAPQRCGQCLNQPPAFDTVWAPFAYEFPIDGLVQQYKFSDQLVYGRLLARLMLETRRPRLPEILVPVPLHPTRLRERGFNQATELALHLGRELELPVSRSQLVRTIDTVAQAGLSATKRRANLKQAFSLRGSLKQRHVALVDDVMTTGSTAHQCARALKAGGVTQVDIWVCARA